MRWLTAEGVMWSRSAAALKEPVRAASSKACSARRSRVESVSGGVFRQNASAGRAITVAAPALIW